MPTIMPSRKVIFAGSVEVGDLDFDVATQVELDVVTSVVNAGGYLELSEIASPGNPAANKVRVYARDTGGVTELVGRRSDGSIAVLAPEVWAA